LGKHKAIYSPETPSAAATAWSDYNHDIAGIFVTVMSLFAMLSYKKSLTWSEQ
jgi:putative copper resistance protein D